MSVFSEYATRTALQISVSVPQVRMLWILHSSRGTFYRFDSWGAVTLQALLRKGLIERDEDRMPKFVLHDPPVQHRGSRPPANHSRPGSPSSHSLKTCSPGSAKAADNLLGADMFDNFCEVMADAAGILEARRSQPYGHRNAIVTRLTRRWFWVPTYVVRCMGKGGKFGGDLFPIHFWNIGEHRLGDRDAA